VGGQSDEPLSAAELIRFGQAKGSPQRGLGRLTPVEYEAIRSVAKTA
jgi:hypothetical protein